MNIVKKIIAQLIVFAMIIGISIPVNVLATTDSITNLLAACDPNTKVVTVTGNTSSGADKQVTIRITDPDTNLEFLNETTSSTDGAFAFTYIMTNTVLGTYTVTVSGEGVLTQGVTTFVLLEPSPTPTPVTDTPTPTPDTPTPTVTPTPVPSPVAFTDVPENAWYKNAVDYLSARGIINGVGGNLFNPDGKIKRADFLIIVMRAYEIQNDLDITDNFVDAGDTYYTAYLGTAKRIGLVKGTGGYYYPTKSISRQDMFVILYRALYTLDKLPTSIGSNTLADFTDANQISDYAYIPMRLFVETGTIVGYNSKLTPLATATRAQAAQLLYNMIAIV
ncbi:MAG: S-layer homology domain-containing protein [Clostridia bacterium]|jgi:hypothetical protein